MCGGGGGTYRETLLNILTKAQMRYKCIPQLKFLLLDDCKMRINIHEHERTS